MFLYKQREEVRAYFCPFCKDYLMINPYIGLVEYCKAEDIKVIDLDTVRKESVVNDSKKPAKRKK
jgi:hypothetical protein